MTFVARRPPIAAYPSGTPAWSTEGFLAPLKRGLVHHERYTSREQARASIFEYVQAFYNRVRLHSSLGYLPLERFEQSHDPKHP